ncbi:MAG: putative glycoside hydrolase [Gemmatimonadales bacterium]
MFRSAFCTVVAAFLAVPAGAQVSAPANRWGDELGDVPLPAVRSLPASAAQALRWPAPPLIEPPGEIRAIYLNAWAFGGKRFHDLVRLADTTEINAFVVDVKDDTGYLTYRSAVPTAIAIGGNDQRRARDTEERLRLLQERGIYTIARIVVAKDPLLAVGKPAWAVRHVNGGLWRDRLGFAWVDAFNDSVWVYAAQLAEEAVRMGFAEVQYDYVRFPDEPRSRLASAVFAARDSGETKRQAVARGLAILRERTRRLGVPFTIDVFGLTTTATGDLGIGQLWEDLVTSADVVLPMVYPSHYHRGMYASRHPNGEPYRIVRRALEDGLRRSASLGKTAEIRPYLQAFTLGPPRYTPAEVRAQIRAVNDLGLASWVLWNPRSAYDPGIFRKEPTATAMRGVSPAAAGPAQ